MRKYSALGLPLVTEKVYKSSYGSLKDKRFERIPRAPVLQNPISKEARV